MNVFYIQKLLKILEIFYEKDVNAEKYF